MTNAQKERIIIFSREAFKKFYNENYRFLSEDYFKPGKRTYRNLLSINKMMKQYCETKEDYINKSEVIKKTGWGGSSSYVQHERVITNFDLSDTSWKDNSRPVLLLNENGKKLRNKYKEYIGKNPEIDLMTLNEIPTFAVSFIIDELKNTTASNMTLWKNTILTAMYLYCELGYMPYFAKKTDVPSEREKEALINCCNYTNGTELMDLTYIQQPIAMLKNLGLLDERRCFTNKAYKLLSNMKMFSEIDASLNDYESAMKEEMNEVQEILEGKVRLAQVEAPERKKRKSKIVHIGDKSINRNFEALRRIDKMTGDLGEKLVLDYERERLKSIGEENVEEKVFLTSSKIEKYGNAYPCDIISYNPDNGNVIYIEVKTTKGSAEDSFYISSSEVEFSNMHKDQYRLFRVFNALTGGIPKFYAVDGSVEDNFSLKEDRYVASRYLDEEEVEDED